MGFSVCARKTIVPKSSCTVRPPLKKKPKRVGKNPSLRQANRRGLWNRHCRTCSEPFTASLRSVTMKVTIHTVGSDSALVVVRDLMKSEAAPTLTRNAENILCAFGDAGAVRISVPFHLYLASATAEFRDKTIWIVIPKLLRPSVVPDVVKFSSAHSLMQQPNDLGPVFASLRHDLRAMRRTRPSV